MPTDLFTWEGIIYGFLHDLAIAAYIGGAVAMEYVLGPAQRSIPPAQAQVMGQKSADRFLWIVWVSLGVIVVSGILRLEHLGHLSWSWPFVEDTLKLSRDYGRTLWTMVGLWCLLVVNGTVMTFYFRPRLAGKLKAGASSTGVQASQQAKMQAATWVERITRADIVIAVVLALLGASLKYGGLL